MGTVDEIAKVINWYDDNYRTSSIEDLLASRDKIAVLSFRLAEQCGDSKKEYNVRRFIKKIEFSRQKQEFMNSGSSGIKADAEATDATEMQYREELEHEAIGFKMDLILRQTNKILEAMNQRISHLKKEKENSKHQV